jgi:outer membrane protein OmpA-like peptidoglycan-associated protein
MIPITNKIVTLLKVKLFRNRSLQSLFFLAFLSLYFQNAMQAQEVQYTKPSWWFGVAAGANFNFYRGSTQQLTADFTPPTAFHNGNGVGLFIAPLIEFHRPDSRWGFMFQAGYDSRKGAFNEVNTPCNCPADLSTKLSYLTVEPSIRFAPFKSNLYFYGGPRIAFNMDKSFTYEQKTNPSYPLQVANPDINGDFSDMKQTIISMQVGVGYDIPISSQTSKTQWMLSPFVAFHPYFGQNPRAIETWNLTTLRAGIALKFGQGHKVLLPEEVKTNQLEAEVKFTIDNPINATAERRVREVFPIRNYVFFDAGENSIASRYVILNSAQAKQFKIDKVQLYTPKNMSGRSERQMIVYYNILNILGDRMVKFPNSSIKLVGSSASGKEDGVRMAESIKTYLTSVFGINASRIVTIGRIKPTIPSEQLGGKLELELLREGDRRVSIETKSPELLMEFQSGPSTSLKAIELFETQQAPATDNFVTFNATGANEAYTSWTLVIKDSDNYVQNHGPYTKDSVTLPLKSIMGKQPEGDYEATMTGITKSGKTVIKETKVHLVPFVAPEIQESIRFSVLFEFNKSVSIALYEKYLTDVVTPKIPKGGKVIIHGHTDIIGEEAYNKELSLARANNVKSIIEKSLAKAGRTDVTFEVYGYGEDTTKTPFENKYPEERFYNRTVVIDVVPNK